MTPSAATVHYRDIFQKRTPEQLRTLAHIKRFMERLVSDRDFRAALSENLDSPTVVTTRYGIEVDPMQMLPLYRASYLKFRFDPTCTQWPLATIWDEYMAQMLRHRDLLREEGNMAQVHPSFHLWRERQIHRCASELGGSASSVTHPVIAFELSEGCTVGCWFCGLSADRFQGHYPYSDDNAAMWRGVVAEASDLLGPAVRTGFCYWATDPCDNPDYDNFLLDYYDITGALPQTTTAAPLKDIALTRRVLGLFDKYRTVTNRFSVLTPGHLNQIHAAFSPEELLGVELVMQNKDALSAKADAGRARQRKEKLRAANKDEKIALVERDHTTIACVSGFLVNMMRGRVQLVTPVPGSARWPLGYRIIGEQFFESPQQFRVCMESLIDQHMPVNLPPDRVVSFRRDLAYEARHGSFTLRSRSTVHTVHDDLDGVSLGDRISSANATASQLVAWASERGADLLAVVGYLDNLFAAGILEDDPDLPDRAGATSRQSARSRIPIYPLADPHSALQGDHPGLTSQTQPV